MQIIVLNNPGNTLHITNWIVSKLHMYFKIQLFISETTERKSEIGTIRERQRESEKLKTDDLNSPPQSHSKYKS